MKQSSPLKEWNIQDKPREKFLKYGPQTLSDAELLAIMLGSGVKNKNVVDLAKEILASVNDNLEMLGRKSIEELCAISGLGPVKAMHILASLELGLRRDNAANHVTIIRFSSDISTFMYSKIANSNAEEFWVICLNRRNEVINCKMIGKGGISAVYVDIKLLLKYVIMQESSSFIVCHNHPSGNIKPSKQDIELTRNLIAASKSLQLSFLDHVILSCNKNKYFSMNDEGILDFDL